jgi:cyclopropane fatty-acyl-phospholipid synthase-like methyltransferase
MARKGAYVTAIDGSDELLTIFSESCKREGIVFRKSESEDCKTGSVRVRLADITKMASYGEGFEVVIAVDILPYLASRHLKNTMEKIRNCLIDHGVLIGTIFDTESSDSRIVSMMRQLGAHYYEGGIGFVEALLRESGFSPEKIERREEGGFRFRAHKI